ncbi:hypothetical protein D3C76_1325900 [compost metagenome]
MDTRRQHAVITDMNRANVQHHAVEIGVKIFSEENVIAVITAKTWLDICAFGLAKKVSQYCTTFGFSIGFRVVIAMNQMACAQALCPQCFIRGAVKFTGNHLLFFFTHGKPHWNNLCAIA